MKLDFSNRWLAPAFVVVAACAVYVNSIGNGFALDDVFIIHQNARVHDVTAWRHIWLTPYWPFFGTELGLYRPFIIFVYAVQWAIGDGATWVFHAGNVLLHATATLLVFLLLERLIARTPALIGALIFAVHPVHTEAVANVVGQAEIVAAIALLAACLIHITRPDGVAVSWPRRIALCLLFAIGLTTKESAVVLPGLLVALDFAQRRVRMSVRGFANYADALLMPVVLLASVLALYLIVRFDVMSGALIGVDAAPSLPWLREDQRILNALRAFPEFARLLFFPKELTSDYSPGVILPVDSLTMMTVFGAVLLLLTVVLALATPWWPSVGLPAAWFIISIITVSNLFFPIGVLIAERTLYVPSVAVSLMAAYAWRALAPSIAPRRRQLAAAAFAAILLLGAVRTWTRNPAWDSTQAVLYRLAHDHPESYRAQWMQGSILWRQGNIDEAHFRFALAYRIHPRDSQLMVEYAEFLQGRDNPNAALFLLEQAYTVHPYIPRTVTILAHAYLVAGRYQDALGKITEAEYYGAARATSMPMRAHAYQGLGLHDRAVGAWRVALQDPSLTKEWLAWAFLARTLAIAGYPAEAAAAVDRARALATDSTAKSTVSRLETAMRDGCFRIASSAAPQGIETAVPACDPLGDDYFRFSQRQAKTATPLHNASKPYPPGTGEGAADSTTK